ncbi:MAG: PilZ domain-containing protein [Rhodospirillaceae bacterium]|nr:PilZ domain-containing protein [Rhodospirillaceae bacterium]
MTFNFQHDKLALIGENLLHSNRDQQHKPIEVQMPNIDEDSDRRIHERVDLQRMMFLRVGEATFMGLLHDVSHSGAKFVFDETGAADGQVSTGDDGVIVVDGIGEVPGSVARFNKDSVVFTFSISERAQEEVVANIMIAQNEMDLKPVS